MVSTDISLRASQLYLALLSSEAATKVNMLRDSRPLVVYDMSTISSLRYHVMVAKGFPPYETQVSETVCPILMVSPSM